MLIRPQTRVTYLDDHPAEFCGGGDRRGGDVAKLWGTVSRKTSEG